MTAADHFPGKRHSLPRFSRLPEFQTGYPDMAVYAIGDVQGCLDALKRLLEGIAFTPGRDTIWFTGDLVDRGPQSLEVLRFVKGLEESAVVVLGNHDIHLLAVFAGTAQMRRHNTFQSVLTAPDRGELMAWLARRPLFHFDENLDFAMVHAGLLPQWDLSDARALAGEVERAIASQPKLFFSRLFGDQPDHWEKAHAASDRWRVIVNAMTRLRYCDAGGTMALRHKESPLSKPARLLPWFDVPGRRSEHTRIIFGHWSTLGLCRGKRFISLDSGCGWGGDLTAARIDVSPVAFYDVPGPRNEPSDENARLIFPVPNPEHAHYLTGPVQRVLPVRV